ncbi:MAG: indole-3-glycerol phosphate synthase TrpC [Planctomycetota bacterium]|nr:MAG: indole-3-glycerol phosphate synthase TrpC [Planctomycetota bacterium]
MPPTTILDQIIAHKRQAELPHLPPVDRQALSALPACRGFAAAVRRKKGESIQVIAESKKGSPSRGVFHEDYDPVRNAYHYQLGGAACVSVLTDERFFYGHCDHLVAVREAVNLPIIRKDFVIDERQIAEARLLGADAILLIAACLEQGQLRDLQGFAHDLGLDVLIEVHNAVEAEMALQVHASLVGVNNRNLHDFSVDLQTTFDLLPALLGNDRVVVSESGIIEREQCRRLEDAGVDAILVGETLMRADDPASALRRLRGQIASSGLA